MSVNFFRPKIMVLAAAMSAAGLYYGSFQDGEAPAESSAQIEAQNAEPLAASPVASGAPEQESPISNGLSAGNPALEDQGGGRSPAYVPAEEAALSVESSPDFFQAGKLDLNLRYIMEKDPAFLESNARVAALIEAGQKVRAEDIQVPAGFRVSLRIEPQCVPAASTVLELEEMEENARKLLESGNPAYVTARTRAGIDGNELAKALQAEACVTAAGAELMEDAGEVSFSAEPLTNSTRKTAYQIMRNAGLVELFAQISYATFGSASVTLAVIDTGVNTSHPDLREIATGDRDDAGHGTMVAGTAAAPSNRIGAMGSMPFHVRVRSFKVNSPGKTTASTSSINNGILRAAYENADVINVSWSGFSKGSYRSAIRTAVAKGSLVTGSGGNSSLKVYTNTTIPGAIAVGALQGTNNSVASYSNWGPGVELYTPGTYMTTMRNGSYALVNGTSFAAPLVGGIALMIKAYGKSRGQDIPPAEIERMIMDTSVIISTGRGYVKKMRPMAAFQRAQRSYL